MLLPEIGLPVGVGGLGLDYAVGRDRGGYLADRFKGLQSPTVAITAEGLALTIDPQ